MSALRVEVVSECCVFVRMRGTEGADALVYGIEGLAGAARRRLEQFRQRPIKPKVWAEIEGADHFEPTELGLPIDGIDCFDELERCELW